ncbi:hypothetical protein [Solibacillus isronensis]|uniref:hypothetical protein n=1 Tax=Solibacillus isronensis TaxID=412383 RepID=UPI0039A2301A
MRYIPNDWHDHIVDPITQDIVQQGTRFTAARANNIEEALAYLMNVHNPNVDQELKRIYLELEMMGRSPVNNGTFFATFDGGENKQMTMLKQKAVLQQAISAGATTLTVDVAPFLVGENIILADEEQTESVEVLAISDTTITVSATTKAFKKGAFVTRTNAQIDTGNQKLMLSNWSTYSISEVV